MHTEELKKKRGRPENKLMAWLESLNLRATYGMRLYAIYIHVCGSPR